MLASTLGEIIAICCSDSIVRVRFDSDTLGEYALP